jgi:hypothetical protein
MADALPNVIFSIKPNLVTRNLEYLDSAVPVASLAEIKIPIKATDLEVSVANAIKDPIGRIIAIIPPAKQAQLTLNIDNGVDPAFSIRLPLSKLFVYTPSEVFAGFIKSVTISTPEITDITVEVRLYN